VSKAIDKAAGAHRRDVYADTPRNMDNEVYGKGLGVALLQSNPVTDAAREWSGWGTALKPAHEPIVVARKPLVGTVAANVLEHGTGALNIDACRIAGDMSGGVWHGRTAKRGYEGGWDSQDKPNTEPHAAGRWPANVVLDEDQAAELDRQSGNLKPATSRTDTVSRGLFHGGNAGTVYADGGGGASRFFYVAKAPARERPKVDGTAHPTVKPLTLMRWLCRLVTPPGGVILEPFAGSGTTVEAALLEGFRVVAIEREADYLPLIQARLDRVAAQEPEDEQLTLDASA
jgi:site-specific DNA-methyltransferase (adenine-specific)